MPHLAASRHADHDRLLVAAYAAGDAAGTELDAAQAQVAACPECAALHHDLRSIAAALPALPPPARSRDFRLTPGQAAALRPPAWRRLLEPFAGPRFAFAGPLGTGLATLGIAGLLLAGSLGSPLAAPMTANAPGTNLTAVTAPSDGSASTSTEYGASASEAPGSQAAAPVQMLPAASPLPQESAPSARNDAATLVPASPPSAGANDPAATGVAGGATGGAEAPAPGSPEPDDQELAAVHQQSLFAPSAEPAAKEADVSPLAPATTAVPMVALAGLLLAAGLALGGLRLAARRLA